jgi:DNA-binding transcriptional ArsR family regulator
VGGGRARPGLPGLRDDLNRANALVRFAFLRNMARIDSPDAQIARVLSHPLRPRILQILTDRGEASPNEIAAELNVPLGTLSYHTRLLRDAGWIELVREVPRRGAVEHFYRAVVRPEIDDAHWERLPLGARRRLASMTVGELLQSAAAAATAGGFDIAGVHVDRVPLELDEQGWEELSALLVETLEEARRIQERSYERRSSRVWAAVQHSELAILHFATADDV